MIPTLVLPPDPADDQAVGWAAAPPGPGTRESTDVYVNLPSMRSGSGDPTRVP